MLQLVKIVVLFNWQSSSPPWVYTSLLSIQPTLCLSLDACLYREKSKMKWVLTPSQVCCSLTDDTILISYVCYVMSSMQSPFHCLWTWDKNSKCCLEILGRLVYTCLHLNLCMMLLKSMGCSHLSLSQLFIMKVKVVWHFVTYIHEVVTSFLLLVRVIL